MALWITMHVSWNILHDVFLFCFFDDWDSFIIYNLMTCCGSVSSALRIGFLYNWFVFAILDNAIIELQLLTLWFNKLLAGVICGFLEGTAKEFFEKLCFTKIGRTGSYMPMVLGFFYLRVPNRGCHKVPRNTYCFHGINKV